MEDARGSITYCSGKDTSGDLKEGVAEFNKLGNEVKVKLLEFPESADEQRNQFTQRQRAESGECDGFEADLIWTAEFASQGWLREMTPYVEGRKAEFVPSTLSSVDYDGKLWVVPRSPTPRSCTTAPTRSTRSRRRGRRRTSSPATRIRRASSTRARRTRA